MTGSAQSGQAELAQLNVARLIAPIDATELADFVAMLDDINAAAEGWPGFRWRLVGESGPGATSVRMLGDDMLIVNMSTWASLDDLRSFVTGHDGHREALRRRHDWFERVSEHMTVCWPIVPGHRPSPDEAERELLALRTEGPSAARFPFTYRGRPYD